MDREELPKRKSTRLKSFDYSSAGAYFVTICTKDRKRILSNIIKPSVGVGAFDDPMNGAHDDPPTPQIRLTEIGKVTEKYLLSSENIPGVKIDRYVIMPDHVHMILRISAESILDGPMWPSAPAKASIDARIRSWKTLIAKQLKQSIWQRSYFDHVIRCEQDYLEIVKYIDENPAKWYYQRQRI